MTVTTVMKPLIYGYMRVGWSVGDQVVADLDLRLQDHAERLGFTFAAVFHESDLDAMDAWFELKMELRRADCRHVIVPSMNHVSSDLFLRRLRLGCLLEETGAEVLDLE